MHTSKILLAICADQFVKAQKYHCEIFIRFALTILLMYDPRRFVYKWEDLVFGRPIKCMALY